MDSDAESSLIAKLQSPDLHHIQQLFSDYLRPFNNLISTKADLNTKKTKKPSNAASEDPRSLAKKFLSFLNRALSLIPKRLLETPKIDEQFSRELFSSYKLCLQCLECISSQLSCKPYTVHTQRVRLIQCFEAWGRYTDAESDGFSVLEGLRGINGTKPSKKKCRFLPDLEKDSVDRDFASLVVEIVVRLVKCVFMKPNKEERDYRTVLILVDEVAPWFRVIDASAYEKLHRALVTYLNKCALLLVEELKFSNKDLVLEFSSTMFAEFRRLSMKDQLYKFAYRICSSLLSDQDNQSSSIIDILFCILDSIAIECKVDDESTAIEFLEFVCYCANKCRTSRRDLCSALATHLTKLAGDFYQVGLILRLYRTGLILTDNSGQLGQDSEITTRRINSGSRVGFLLDKDDVLRDLSVLLGRLKCLFTISKSNTLPTSAEFNCQMMCPDMSSYEATGVCNMNNGKLYLLPYYNALKFFCLPLVEFVNSARKEIFVEIEGDPFLAMLCTIRDALIQFCDVFLVCHSTFGQESNAFDDYNRTMLGVAAAALALSFRTNFFIKESVIFIKQVLSCDWVQANALKSLFASLHNIGITLYRSNQVKEASKAVKLCCRVAWACVSHLCETFVNESNRVSGNVSEDDVANLVNDACAESAFLLDLLYQCKSRNKAIKIIGYSLENWSAAANVFNRLQSPLALVKQWVKIECKLCKDPDTECAAVTLYSLLSSSDSVSKRSLGVILEQELLSYKEMIALNPKLCRKMRIDIMDVLLAELYVTDDTRFKRSIIFITKGWELRANGIEGLNDCIQCLSEAISLLNDVSGDRVPEHNAVNHHLAVACSLRALCVQEAEPNSKRPFQDIHAAIKLWLKPECFSDDLCGMAYENMLIILYYVLDMLSLKGCTEYHPGIYELLIRLFAKKNIPLDKCLVLLWQCRRLSHALCASPLNEEFVSTLSQHCGKTSQSIDFWKSCLNGLLPQEMGFWQCFSFMFTNISCGVSHLGGSFLLKIKVEDVQQAASDLASSVPLCSGSAFLAAHLFYDLCERVLSNGQLSEALSYAKEAHRLRSKLLQEKFRYSIKKQDEIYDGAGGIVQKRCCDVSSFQMYSSVATAAWSQDNILFDLEGTVLTPWNVLQCYLESTLQVGIVHELIGNGSEAEALLLWGKSISRFQGLPLFELVFSSVLGRVYRKQQLWDQAEKELQSAELILKNSCTAISCLKCRSLLEVTIILELADLFRSRRDSYTGNLSVKRLCHAETLYASALDKLNCSEWKNPVSNGEESRDENSMAYDTLNKKVGFCASSSFAYAADQPDVEEVPSKSDVPETRKPARRSRKVPKSSKTLLQGQSSTTEPNLRITRSKYRHQTNKENASYEVPVELTELLNHEQHFDFADTLVQRGPLLEIRSASTDSGSETTCFCNKLKCWHCLPIEVIESGSVNNFVLMKWELARRRLSLKLLAGLGKCLDAHGKTHESHEQLVQSISVLVRRNTFSAHSSVKPTFLLDLIGKDIHGDAFTVEYAALLYNICWLTLKSYPCKGSRINCCDMAQIQISKIISWLMLAFVLCREIPVLFQKVSRLLAVIFVLSASTELFLQSVAPCKVLSESQWAYYFHQASIGTHVNHQIFSSMIGKEKIQDPSFVEGSCLSSSRLAPELLQDLERSVLRFFDGFPCATIIGISLLGGAFAPLLSKLLECSDSACAWLLLSRLNSNCQPIVILLPVDSILEGSDAQEDDTSSGSGTLFEDKKSTKCWHSPWGSTVVDEVAPEFRLILEENYLSSSVHPLEDTKQNRSLWWMKRKTLDQRLGKFVRDLEDLWLGPWKYLLLGEWSGCPNLESVLRKLRHDLKVKCEVDTPETLLKVILGGAKLACLREECVMQLILNKGCLIGGVGCYNQERSVTLSDRCDDVENLSKRALKLILEAAMEVEEECLNREPVILVLDFDVQMLPWENLPVLRNHEVYRMPSVGSIFATLDRCYPCREKIGRNLIAFPMVDPLDAFYLLNPSGDLSSTQAEFEDWFRDQHLEGKAGITPTVEELVAALRSHDLFIYFGHGSGAQYIPGHEIEKLKNCAATLLMGCSSGCLSLNGCYAPKGAPLCYLLAGSPVIIANLWDVTDKDIDRFGKAMLDSWLRERSTASIDCLQCNNLVAEKFKSMQIAGTKGNTKRKNIRKNLPKDFDLRTLNDCCNHRPKIGSFVGQAREACKLPFLIGASPVCYGVPTLINIKKEL